ncbi:MAG: translesion DNA synthesis-associated protein ImuA [Aquisalimonadaceae bacterium]
MNDTMHELLRQPGIWRAGTGNPRQAAIPSGFTELDQALPGGGWPENALTEVLHDQYGIGELRLLMPALARLSRSGRWIALIAPPHIPYAPALAAQGVDLSHVLLVHPRASGKGHDALWALEQALRSGTCAAVLGWPAQADERQLRRLQLAAEAGGTWGILFRRETTADQSSPAALRLRLRQDEQGTLISLLKCRGGMQRQQIRLDLDRPRVRAMPVSPRSCFPQMSLPLEAAETTPGKHGRLRLVRQPEKLR